ncbi:MAG: hypothetical protein NT177_03135 [Chloroflexi bacterium]|nr:hypothetical protein [Chloroflexota bacterium]
MKLRINPYHALLPVAVLSMLTGSCSGFFSPATSITDLTPTTGFVSDYHPLDSTSVFYVDSPQVCCSARVTGATDNTSVQADWVYIRGDMAKEAGPLIRQDRAVSDKDGYVGFTLPAPDDGFISGDYRVDLTVNGRPGGSAGFSIGRDASMPLPQIVTFTASSYRTTSDQPILLNWKVSNASRVDIQPAPGIVPAEGNQAVTPAEDTGYTLYAVNRNGSSSSTLKVNVSPPVKEKPDLQVTEFWSSGNVLAYRVKNAGDLASCPTMSYLYKNDLVESKDYVAPLAPGEERVEAFQQYHFSPRFNLINGSAGPEDRSGAVNIRICVNGDGSCVENDLSNNCLEQNFGPLLRIDFSRLASAAQWQTTSYTLKWPVSGDRKDGMAYTASAQVAGGGNYPYSLLVAPPPEGGWIQGIFSLHYGTPPTSQPILIPHKGKFTCKVAVTQDTAAPVSARFRLGIRQGNEISYFPPVTINSADKIEVYEVDLGKLAGQKAEFVFRVESDGPWRQGSAAWIDAALIQER